MKIKFFAYSLVSLIGVAIPLLVASYAGGEIDTDRFVASAVLASCYVWYLWRVIGKKFVIVESWIYTKTNGICLSSFLFTLSTSFIATIFSVSEMPNWVFILICVVASVGALNIIAKDGND